MIRAKKINPNIVKEEIILDGNTRLANWIFKTVVITLCIVVLAVTVAMMRDLVRLQAEDDKILAIIAPAFNTVIGAFVGLLGGLSLKRKK
jgi:hypothetical protein